MSRLPLLLLLASALLWPSCSPVSPPESRTVELTVEGIVHNNGLICSTAVESVRVEASRQGFASTVTRPVLDLGKVSVPLTVPGGSYVLTAELLSNVAPLYRGTTQFQIEKDDFLGTVTVAPIDGVPVLCPSEIVLSPGITRALLMNWGSRPFSWSLDTLQLGPLNNCVSVITTQGTVGPGDSTEIVFDQFQATDARAPIVVATSVGRLPAAVRCREAP